MAEDIVTDSTVSPRFVNKVTRCATSTTGLLSLVVCGQVRATWPVEEREMIVRSKRLGAIFPDTEKSYALRIDVFSESFEKVLSILFGKCGGSIFEPREFVVIIGKCDESVEWMKVAFEHNAMHPKPFFIDPTGNALPTREQCITVAVRFRTQH